LVGFCDFLDTITVKIALFRRELAYYVHAVAFMRDLEQNQFVD
jgi:hypothetical protein